MSGSSSPSDGARASGAGARSETSTKVSVGIGVVAAMILAVLANVLVARHYRRWDVTSGGLYTLSEPTLATLHALEEPVEIVVLLGAADPLAASVGHLLEAYRAETGRLNVRFLDPDRSPAEFLAAQQRFGIVPGKTDDGRIVTDAAIVVARGSRVHFLTDRDLVAVDEENELRARPRLEEALTGALRSVLGGERPRICFSTGHGEKSIDAGGAAGLAPLRDRLTKNNYDVAEFGPRRTATPGTEPLAGCSVAVLAGPSDPVAPEDASDLATFVERGGSALLVVGQVPDGDQDGYLDLGVDRVLALGGAKLQRDFVFERSPERRSAQGLGETFLPYTKPHPITEGLLRAAKANQGLEVVVTVASSIVPVDGPAAPAPLLVTSNDAFGMIRFFEWAKRPGTPLPAPDDHAGPLVIAQAAERPKTDPAAPRGARVVVVSSVSVLYGANWQDDGLRGTATFVESSIAWLAARPSNLAIPKKPAFARGIRLTEERLGAVFRYVVVFMPLAAALLGVAVAVRRRTERRGPPKPKAR